MTGDAFFINLLSFAIVGEKNGFKKIEDAD